MKNGLVFGLLAGIIYLGWIIIGGEMFPNLIYGSIPSITISSILTLIFMVFACQKEKSSFDGSLRFGEAFLVCLMTYAAFNIIYGIGFKFYMEGSATAMATFVDTTKTSMTELMTKMGTPEDEIFKAVEGIDKSLPTMFSWKTTLLNIFGTTIFPGALLALIVAAIFSKLSNNKSTK